jgi:hypothetical protein
VPIPNNFVLAIPNLCIPDSERKKLDASITYNVMKTGEKPLSKEDRRSISDTLAMNFAETLLTPLRDHYEVTDMNTIRKGFPGYDFLVHRKGTAASSIPALNKGLRIQVKGNTAPEWIGFHHSSATAAGMGYDIALIVDMGPNTTARPRNPRGRTPRADLSKVPVQDRIDFYMIPSEEVRQRIILPEQANWKLKYVSYWKIPNAAQSEACVDWPGIMEWRGQADVILRHLHLAD